MYSKDLYNILGVKDAASQEEIKTAFYKVSWPLSCARGWDTYSPLARTHAHNNSMAHV
jgi:hypothetical protein